MLTRPIPSSGEQLPVIGCGTWQTFDVGPDAAARAPLQDVLGAMFEAGGSLIDSSPMYGRSEGVVGDLLAARGGRERPFMATKVWTRGREAGIQQMEQSAKLMQADPLDLIQIHNLLDWQVHLKTLREWKQQGRVRYIGITHHQAGGHADLAAIMRSEALDFVQFNYALDDRAAEDALLPLAADRGIAVLINRPLGQGGLLRKLSGVKLPAFASELGCTNWSELALKYLLANTAVTCIIPATRQKAHMASNCAAGNGALPDSKMCAEIVKAAGV
ncbi:MAG: aldo/keto reductase [Xanthobacteraceae bacterium]|nr:aldo/keto reductase [Xanthobacteraceae bacterium]